MKSDGQPLVRDTLQEAPLNKSDLNQRLRLLVITDTEVAGSRGLAYVLSEALDAGAPAVQLRLKNSSAREMLEEARTLLPLVRATGALFTINDRLDVALAAEADGVHLGPDDLPILDVRRSVPDEFIIGCSVDTLDGARKAEAEGADYLGVGTVYPTENKPDAGDVIGLSGLRQVAEAVDIPVLGIGGITPERASDIAGAGACGAAVIGAVMGAQDPAAAVRALLSPFGGACVEVTVKPKLLS